MTAAIEIAEADPQGTAALALLREAAIEARRLYADRIDPQAPWPANPPTPAGGVYLVAWRNGRPVASAALQPGADGTAEVRRMFVTRSARRRGIGRSLLAALEARARALGYTALRLETGCRQQPAIALYESAGFRAILPFGAHALDPTSRCFAKALAGSLD